MITFIKLDTEKYRASDQPTRVDAAASKLRGKLLFTTCLLVAMVTAEASLGLFWCLDLPGASEVFEGARKLASHLPFLGALPGV
jgi:hypothetical protein